MNTEKQKQEKANYPTEKEVEAEINEKQIDPSLDLSEQVEQCRFQEELESVIRNINFDEEIMSFRFSGQTAEAEKMSKLSAEVKKKLTSLPDRQTYIQSCLEKKKREIDEKNREKNKPEEKKSAEKEKAYTYPFILHFAGKNIEIDHIFEPEKKYTEKEITKKMLEHQYYEFAGDVSYTWLKEDNVLLPIFRQYKKG